MIPGIGQPHRRQADETVDNHYRQLYQIRRAHGDVISRVGPPFAVTNYTYDISRNVCLNEIVSCAKRST